MDREHFSLNPRAKKSMPSIDLAMGNQSLPLREAKSFTGAIDELKVPDDCRVYDGNLCQHNQICTKDEKCCAGEVEESLYETREITSNEIYHVREEMLVHKGKRYSVTDIAQKWKKDCRTWLWKNSKYRLNRSVGELQDKLQNIKF